MRLAASNDNLALLFEDLAVQLSSQLVDPHEVGFTLREKITVEGESSEQLLQAWLNVLLDFVRIQHMIFNKIRITDLKMEENGPYSLRAEGIGELLDPHRHTLKLDPALLRCQEAPLLKDAKGYHAEISL